MSNQPDLTTVNQLYRELGQIATVQTKLETRLQMQLESIYMLAKPYLLPGELPADGVRRLIQEGIEATQE